MIFQKDFIQSLETLQAGGVLLYPTDTVWGLGCRYDDSDALEKIYLLKQRPREKSCILILDSLQRLEEYVTISEKQREYILTNQEPTTIIYHTHMLPSHVCALDGSVAIRIVHKGFAHEVCRELGFPIVSTSANISGMPTPKIFAEIDSTIISGVDYCVYTRREDSNPGKPSRLISFTNDDEIIVLR